MAEKEEMSGFCKDCKFQAEKRIQQLEEALKFYAALADIYGKDLSYEYRVVVKLGWLRKARAALIESGLSPDSISSEATRTAAELEKEGEDG